MPSIYDLINEITAKQLANPLQPLVNYGQGQLALAVAKQQRGEKLSDDEAQRLFSSGQLDRQLESRSTEAALDRTARAGESEADRLNRIALQMSANEQSEHNERIRSEDASKRMQEEYALRGREAVESDKRKSRKTVVDEGARVGISEFDEKGNEKPTHLIIAQTAEAVPKLYRSLLDRRDSVVNEIDGIYSGIVDKAMYDRINNQAIASLVTDSDLATRLDEDSMKRLRSVASANDLNALVRSIASQWFDKDDAKVISQAFNDKVALLSKSYADINDKRAHLKAASKLDEIKSLNDEIYSLRTKMGPFGVSKAFEMGAGPHSPPGAGINPATGRPFPPGIGAAAPVAATDPLAAGRPVTSPRAAAIPAVAPQVDVPYEGYVNRFLRKSGAELADAISSPVAGAIVAGEAVASPFINMYRDAFGGKPYNSLAGLNVDQLAREAKAGVDQVLSESGRSGFAVQPDARLAAKYNAPGVLEHTPEERLEVMRAAMNPQFMARFGQPGGTQEKMAIAERALTTGQGENVAAVVQGFNTILKAVRQGRQQDQQNALKYLVPGGNFTIPQGASFLPELAPSGR